MFLYILKNKLNGYGNYLWTFKSENFKKILSRFSFFKTKKKFISKITRFYPVGDFIAQH